MSEAMREKSNKVWSDEKKKIKRKDQKEEANKTHKYLSSERFLVDLHGGHA